MRKASKKPLNPRKLFMFSTFYVSLFSYYFSSPIASESLAPYNPVENIALDCGSGSPGNSTAMNKRIWVGDSNSKPHNLASSVISKANQPPTAIDSIPYDTARLSRSEFTYVFSVTSGQKFIRLHFYPDSYQNFDRSKAFFSVKAGSFTLLSNFSASLTADAHQLQGFSKEFCINVKDVEKTLNITFTPSPTSPDAYAFVNGIEVVSMPSNLYYTAAGDPKGLNFIGENNQAYRIENNTALETEYRVNVGGGDISPADDTGMYRSWSDDFYYLVVPGTSVLPVNLTVPLHFTMIHNYAAPEAVYRTARTMGQSKEDNKHYNLTWEFSVDSGFFYMVRLHFCEFQPEITPKSRRVFDIYIANQTAEEGADIIGWSGGNGVPIYEDYVVHIGEGNGKKVNLSLALQANPVGWQTFYLDAILNGLEIFKISSYEHNLAGPNPDPTQTSPTVPPPQLTRRKNNRTKIIGIVSGVVSGIVLISMVGLFIFRRSKRVKERGDGDGDGDGSYWWGQLTFHATKSTKTPGSTTLPSDLCRYFSLAEIRAATNNFDNVFIIGVGGFGNVYKGYIDGWAKPGPVAIKRLKPGSQQGAHEFGTEIEMLSQLRHVHLVSLIGYCNEGNEMILVYDFMAHGTLRDHLYNTDNLPLSWKKRLEICIGAAHGLNYLHSGAKHMIIHRDVKTANILLDEEWTAKVCDFGLSKLGPTLSKDHVSTLVKGSFGYLDPEYYRRQQLTEKSDVYSYGVVLCEALCAKPPITRTVIKEQVNLVDWVKQCCREGKLNEIIDPFLKGSIASESLNKFVEVTTNCLLDNGTERPSMNDVAWGLEFALQLQESAADEEVMLSGVEIEMMDAEKALINKSTVEDSGDMFSSSSGQESSTNSNTRVTFTSKEDQRFASWDSDGLMSVGAVFSEISIPKGR